MATYLFDGTNENKDGDHKGTHIYRMNNLLLAAGQKNIFYFGGVGNGLETDGIGRVLAIGFGLGGNDILERALEKFRAAYLEDQVVDVFGFSRGAAISKEFVHRAAAWVAENGHPALRVRFVGLMDTVFSFGLPNDIDIGYHHQLPTDIPIQACYHAIALNESRTWFQVTPQTHSANIETFVELGFKGNHSDIGGGYKDRKLSNIIYNWLLDAAKQQGLEIADQLPAGQAYTADKRAHAPSDWEYYPTDYSRLPFREDAWVFPQGPRTLDPDLVAEAKNNRGIEVCQWAWRIIKDWRVKPKPRVRKTLVNMDPYMRRSGARMDPAKDYKTYKKTRRLRVYMSAENILLTAAENISYQVPLSLDLPVKSRRKRKHR